MSTSLYIEQLEIQEEDSLDIAVRKAGLNYLYPYQRLAVRNILEGVEIGESSMSDDADVLTRQAVFLPTGMGKSLIFTLPAYILKGISVIIYPLLSLMNDQLNRFRSAGIKAAVLKGGQSEFEREAIFRKIEKGELQIIISNPETLNRKEIIENLAVAGIDHLAIDEVHTAVEWGNTFRPSYRELPGLIRKLSPRFVTALTATASPELKKYIRETLFDGIEGYWIDRPPDRPTIRYSVRYTLSPQQTLEELVSVMEKPMIIFCRTRRECEVIARNLLIRIKGISCMSYHAGYSAETRKKIEDWYMESRDGVLIATIAFGMGANKNNIRTVIHLSPSQSPEAYLQESGRAGRDGKPAEAIMLYNPYRKGNSPMDQYALNRQGCQREFLLGRNSSFLLSFYKTPSHSIICLL